LFDCVFGKTAVNSIINDILNNRFFVPGTEENLVQIVIF